MIDLNDENFEKHTQGVKTPVVIGFYAQWCAPCKRLKPAVERIQADVGDSVMFVRVDVDEAPNMLAKYGVRSVPTHILLVDGEEVARLSGGTEADLRKMILSALDK